MTTDPDSPAFPELHIHHFMTDAEGKEKPAIVPRWHGGLTKREYFAGRAMEAMLAAHQWWPVKDGEMEVSVVMADALILALNQKPELK